VNRHALESRFADDMVDRLRSLSNVTRGLFAETLVASAPPGSTRPNDTYDAIDLTWRGITIQVKCSGAIQTWHSNDCPASPARWSTPRRRKATDSGRLEAAAPQRWADVWVLARHEGSDTMSNWRFYVVSSAELDELIGPAGSTVTVAKLKGIAAVELGGLPDAISAAARKVHT
jgi:hypothetical protein